MDTSLMIFVVVEIQKFLALPLKSNTKPWPTILRLSSGQVSCCLLAETMTIVANFGFEEQDRVNCSFYYKVGLPFTHPFESSHLLMLDPRSAPVDTVTAALASTSSLLSPRRSCYRMCITTPHIIPALPTPTKNSKITSTQFLKIYTGRNMLL